MDEPKRKRGRPLKPGAKRKRITIRVTEEQYDEFLELSKLEGESLAKYVVESTRLRGNLTRANHPVDEIEVVQDDDYMDDFYEDEYLEDD